MKNRKLDKLKIEKLVNTTLVLQGVEEEEFSNQLWRFLKISLILSKPIGL